jgi:hypothetical protein
VPLPGRLIVKVARSALLVPLALWERAEVRGTAHGEQCLSCSGVALVAMAVTRVSVAPLPRCGDGRAEARAPGAVRNVAALTIQSPDDKHERLEALAG